MSGVGVSGLLANLPGTVTPYPTQDPSLEFGGYRSVANIAARDAIPANFRDIGMGVTLQDTGVTYKLLGGITNANWVPTQAAAVAFITRADLTELTAQDDANFPNGCLAYVVAERELYQLDTLDPLTTSSPLIVARGAGTGKWYRRSRSYVVGNFTLWCQSYGEGFCGYTPGQLLASGNTEPDIVIPVAGGVPGTGTQYLQTDNEGNLWLSNAVAPNNTRARKWRLADCLRSGAPLPVLDLSAPHVGTPSSTALVIFDRHNGLWLATGENASFGRFAASRFGSRNYSQNDGVASLMLAQTGAPAPNLGGQQDWAFDGEGNLWVVFAFTATSGVVGSIAQWTVAQLNAGGATAPTVHWTGSNFTSPTTGGQCAIALAANGMLWSCDYNTTQLKAWPIAGAVSGNPAPTITLTCATFNGPYSLAFDAAGNLWVNQGNVNSLQRIPKASLAASGAVVADVIITPVTATLTSFITFPNNADRVGLLPSGFIQR